jgi:hypothetical protein
MLLLMPQLALPPLPALPSNPEKTEESLDHQMVTGMEDMVAESADHTTITEEAIGMDMVVTEEVNAGHTRTDGTDQNVS